MTTQSFFNWWYSSNRSPILTSSNTLNEGETLTASIDTRGTFNYSTLKITDRVAYVEPIMVSYEHPESELISLESDRAVWKFYEFNDYWYGETRSYLTGYTIREISHFKPGDTIWWHTVGAADKDDFGDNTIKRTSTIQDDLTASISIGISPDNVEEGDEYFLMEASSSNYWSQADGDAEFYTPDHPDTVLTISDAVITQPPNDDEQDSGTDNDGNTNGSNNSNTNTIDINNSTQAITNITDNSITTIDNSTTINTTNNVNTNISTGNISLNNQVFSIERIPVDVDDAISGSSKRKDFVNGTRRGDIIGFGRGKDLLIGDDGSDQFVIFEKDRFGKRGADTILDFTPNDGDQLIVSQQALQGLDRDAELGIAESKKEFKAMQLESVELIYFAPKGQVYYDQNEDGKGFGQGGLFAILKGAPELGADSFGLM